MSASSQPLPIGRHPQRSLLRSLFSDSLTVFWGDWLDLRVRLLQVIASGLISPLIYILGFGLGLGSAMNVKPPVGDSYLEFILPGMVALSSMTISFGGTTFSICGERLYSKTFEEILLLPVHPLALFLGKMLAGVVRGMMTSAGIIVLALLFTHRLGFISPLFLLLLLLNCAVFSGLGVIVGLNVKSLESVGLLNNFLIVPMSFLGATFFDPGTLPASLKVIVYLLPLTYTSLGLRAAVFQPIAQFPWFSLPVLVIIGMILCAIGAYQFAHQRD